MARDRALNFNPGPSIVPLTVLQRAQRELLDFEGTGMSIMEHSHRGKEYAAVHEDAKEAVRSLLGLGDEHVVMFMQGGARAQFALVPMNLMPPDGSADYVLTGVWAEGAYEEAKVVGSPRVACSTKEADGGYRRVPKPSEIDLDPKAAYVHLTSNNTVWGTQFQALPDTGKVPLVVDMSSDIFSRPIDVSKIDMIYAGAQKNAGIAGITIVIAKKDLIGKARTDKLPKIFRYGYIAKEDSLQNTIPVFPMYMLALTLEWVQGQGGLAAMETRNREKSRLLYEAIDARAAFYRAPVERESRSWMNVVFRLPSEELEAKFVKEAEAERMVGLKGHRSAGGIRVSLYNAMSIEGTKELVAFMARFADKNG